MKRTSSFLGTNFNLVQFVNGKQSISFGRKPQLRTINENKQIKDKKKKCSMTGDQDHILANSAIANHHSWSGWGGGDNLRCCVCP